MKTLIRLALILAVAAVAGLAPAAHAQDVLDRNRGDWSSSDGGKTTFIYGVEKISQLYGPYTSYVVEHVHTDGFKMQVTATHWLHPYYKGLVTFTYRHGDDRGTGEWIYETRIDGNGVRWEMLVGKWKSSKWIGGASGTWILWRRL